MMVEPLDVQSVNQCREWDAFVTECKNAPFFADTKFMHYHNEFRPGRFDYHSLMFYDTKERLIAVMPGNVDWESRTLFSHGGLSFGGVLSTQKMTTPSMLEVFDALLAYMRGKDMSRLVYKPPPYIYHTMPADEDLYALHLHGAYLMKRNPSTVVDLRHPAPVSALRKRALKKAEASGVEAFYTWKDEDLKEFWDILTHNLWTRYGVNPVHTYEEIIYLMKAFIGSGNIDLCTAVHNDSIVAGVMTFASPLSGQKVSRLQYIASTEWGRENGAVDACVSRAMEESSKAGIRWFDFGVSTETKHIGNRLVLNLGLIFQKEGFGGRTVLYDTYALELTNEF